MANLIIHIGPGKCGSSSIRQFFNTRNKPCIQKTRYLWMNRVDIRMMNRTEPDADKYTALTEQISSNLVTCDTLILSHGYLFQCPHAIRNICSIAANLASGITIIGYSRRQSDFMISTYSQWLFRSPDRTREAVDALVDIDLDPIVFSGLERQLIASIANDFYSARQLSNWGLFDWNNSYNNILQTTRESEPVIKCGVLPDKKSGAVLIQDFCDKANLTLRNNLQGLSANVANPSFNHDLIEAINIAVTLGLEVPGPHDQNIYFRLISAKMSSETNVIPEFLSALKAYIDTCFLDSNKQFCETYGLGEKYFTPAVQLDKQQILNIIKDEAQNRLLDTPAIIKKHRMLSAKMAVACHRIVNEAT